MTRISQWWRSARSSSGDDSAKKLSRRRPVRGRSLLCESLEAREMLSTFYVSYSSGSDSNNGTSEATPWQTISKVNNSGFSAGDNILFKRGETWRETLYISNSGTSAAQITFGAYGTGANPIISGANVISGWSLYSDGASVDIYRAPFSGVTIEQCFVDGSRYTLARSSGWSTIDSTASNGSYLYDTALTQADNYWAGATAVVRSSRWSLDSRTISGSSQSAHTLSWNRALEWGLKATSGYGYYLEAGLNQSLTSKLTLLDSAGEYFVDSGYLYIGLANGQTTTGKTVEATVRSYCIYVHGDSSSGRSYFNITDLDITKAAYAGIRPVYASHFTISDVNVTYSKRWAIYLANCTYASIVDSTVAYVEGTANDTTDGVSGIRLIGGSSNSVQDSTVEHMGYAVAPRAASAISVENSPYSTISGNVITDVTASGLAISQGGSHSITNNTVTHCSTALDDGGGIYLNPFGDANSFTGTVIEHNYIADIVPNFDGTPFNPATDTGITVGIYLDEHASGLTMRSNIVAGCCYGTKLHFAHNVNIFNNTFYNNQGYSICLEEAYGGVNCMYSNVIKNNLCSAIGSTQGALQIIRESGSTVAIGVLDYNLYYNPNRSTIVGYSYGTPSYTMAQWKAKTGLDAGCDAHSVSAAPLLVDAPLGNLHLTSSSPCIGAATTITGYTADYDGLSVPQGGTPDIGAYEYYGAVLVAPSNLTASTVSTSQINLAWSDNSGDETGFKIDRATNSDFSGAGTTMFTTSAGATSFQSTGLTEGVTYYYRVRATNGSVDSSNCTWASTAAKPSPPTIGSATAISSSQINVTWTDSSNNESGYEIDRATNSDFSGAGTTMFTTSANATSFQSTGLAANTQYFYRVRATSNNVDSANSGNANATTQPGSSVNLLSDYTFDDAAVGTNGGQIASGAPTGGTYVSGASSSTSSPLIGTGKLALTSYTSYFNEAANSRPNSTAGGAVTGTESLWIKISQNGGNNNPILWVASNGTNTINHGAYCDFSGNTLNWYSKGNASNGRAAYSASTSTWDDSGAAWHLVSVTYSLAVNGGSTATIYLDGTALTTTETVDNFDAAELANVGQFNDWAVSRDFSGAAGCAGSMDDFAVWGTQLSATQVKAAYNLGITGVSSTKYNAKDASTLFDAFTGATGATTSDGRTWSYVASGLSGGAGAVGANYVVLNGSGAGMQIQAAAPAAPTNLTAATISTSQINLAWADNATNETGFEIDRATNVDFTGASTTMFTTSANATSFQSTGLTEGVTYYYRVRATNGSGDSSNCTWASTAAKPSTPTIGSATAISSSQINLTWTDSSNNETGYEIDRATNGDFTGAGTTMFTTSANATSFQSTGLTEGVTYYYRVRATVGGAVDSANSNAANTAAKPSTPTIGSATAVSSSQINVTWTDSSNNESGYEIDRATNSDFSGAGTTMFTTSANATSFQSTGLAANTQYFYRVRATSNNVDSANSGNANATTQPGSSVNLLSDYTFDDAAVGTNGGQIASGAPTGGTYVSGASSSTSSPLIGTGKLALTSYTSYFNEAANSRPNSTAGGAVTGTESLWIKISQNGGNNNPILWVASNGTNTINHGAYCDFSGNTLNWYSKGNASNGRAAYSASTSTWDDSGAAWHLVSVTYSLAVNGGSTATIYLDGTALTTTETVDNFDAAELANVGQFNDWAVSRDFSGAAGCAGSMDDFAVWGTQLSATQVKAAYNLGITGVSSTKYNAKDASTLFDAFAGQTSVTTSDNRTWSYVASGLSGGAGAVGANYVVLNGSGAGMQIQAMRAADGEVTGREVEALTQETLDPVVDMAMARWEALMRGTGQVAAVWGNYVDSALANVQVVISDLPGDMLGSASGSTIYLDTDAAGHGWYADQLFSKNLNFKEKEGVGMDLLTVVSHELGHVLGLDHAKRGVMSGTLEEGVRELPTRGDLRGLSSMHGRALAAAIQSLWDDVQDESEGLLARV